MFAHNENNGTESVKSPLHGPPDATAKLIDDDTHLGSALLPPSEGAPANPRCRDVGWAVAFVAQMGCSVAVALSIGIPQIRKAYNSANVDVDAPVAVKTDVIEVWFGSLGGLAFTGMMLSWIWLKVMLAYPATLITFTFYMTLALKGLALLITLYYGMLWPAVGIAVMIAIFLCYWRAWKSRIPFAAANLEIACLSIKQYYGVVYTAMGKQIVALVWGAVYLTGVVGLYIKMTKTVDCPTPAGEISTPDTSNMCLETDKDFTTYATALSFSLIWTKVTMMYVVHATAASNVGTWWFTPYQVSATWDGFYRSCTTSLGSLSYAAFIIAAIETVRNMVDRAQRSAKNNRNSAMMMILCCMQCIMGMIEAWAKFVNRYAIVYVGVYGYSFCESVNAIKTRLHARLGGFVASGPLVEAMISDTLIDSVLMFGCLAVALVNGAVGVGIGYVVGEKMDGVDKNVQMVWLGIAGLLLGYFMAYLICSVISSAAATVFVCFVEDGLLGASSAMKSNHPMEYDKIVNAWQARRGSILAVGGLAAGAGF
jgi:hypothetical protein